jgi:predicted nucleic acid-binding protein
MTNCVRVLDVAGETIEAAAQARNQCRLIGHVLHQPLSNIDRLIAAAAIRWSLPLLAHDECSSRVRSSISRPQLAFGEPQ